MPKRGKNHRDFLAKITDEEYEVMLAKQGGRCAICNNPPKVRRLNVDHDHKLMKVRGLLCHRCNRVLPSWVTPDWLERAKLYIEKSLATH